MRRPKAARSVTLVIFSVTLWAGCGGGDSDAERQPSDAALVQKTVVSWYQALARGDGAAACALMTPAARKRDLSSGPAVTLQPDGSIKKQPTTCKALIEAAGRELTEGGVAPSVNDAVVQTVDILNDQATVTAAFASRQQSLLLRRSGGQWRIDGVPR
jgi:hypothetical protein